MKKDVESEYNIVDEISESRFNTKAVLLPIMHQKLWRFSIYEQRNKQPHPFGMQNQHCLMFQIPHEKSYNLRQSKLDQWYQL